MRVKICGITKTEDALVCSENYADAIGYIFYPKSKRYITPEKAGKISAAVNPFVTKIGVFVNESAEKIRGAYQTAGLDAVQLHGDETPEFASSLGIPVIKSFRVRPGFDFGIIKDYNVKGILLDSWSEEYGGSGLSFDWQLIPEEYRKKIILAGGVSAENVSEIQTRISPAAVDVSSSVELSPGIKDHKKLTEFLKIINKIKSDKRC